MKGNVVYESPRLEVVVLSYQSVLCESPRSFSEGYGTSEPGSWQEEE